jgi:ElaA protein
MQLTWKYNCFSELGVGELYAILQLRNEVFVIEQNCIYQDADNKDGASYHLMGWDGDTLACYCRILPPGVSYPEASIGRVVSSPSYRNIGCGRELMNRAIILTQAQFHCNTIKISAQLYLQQFYSLLGFVQVSETYLEDNIPHIEMLLNKEKTGSE